MCTKYFLDLRCPSSILLGVQIIKSAITQYCLLKIHSTEENYFQWLKNSVLRLPEDSMGVYFIFPEMSVNTK